MSALLLNPSMYAEDSEVADFSFNDVTLFETADILFLAVIAIVLFVVVFKMEED